MKKLVSLFLSLLLLLSLTGCGNSGPELPKIRAVTQNHSEETEKPDYWLVRPGKKPKRTEEFTPDKAAVYQVDCSQITASVVDGKVQNHIDRLRITDSQGAQFDDKTLETMAETVIKSIDHDIIQFTIIENSGYYFAFIKLNVNWSDPCDLYRYDLETNTLHKLAHWDNVDLVGIAVDDETEQA